MKFKALFVYSGLTLSLLVNPLHSEHMASHPTTVLESHDQVLASLVTDYWHYWMQALPETATFLGYNQYNGELSDYSKEAFAKHEQKMEELFERFVYIDLNKLSTEKAIDYMLFKWDLENYLNKKSFYGDYLLINQIGGIHQDINLVLGIMPTETEHDYRNILSRLIKLPMLLEQQTAWLREGYQKGVTPPKIVMKEVPAQVRALAQGEAIDSVFMSYFEGASEEIKRLALAIVKFDVYPAIQAFGTFLQEEYIPNCVEKTGMLHLPDGKAWYAAEVRSHTTTDLCPQDIHEMGLEEVKRIETQINTLMSQLGFMDHQDFLTHLSTAPEFYFNSREELLEGYRSIITEIERKLPEYFHHLPKTQLEVIAVPESIEKAQVAAFYLAGSLENNRPGYFFVNTYNVDNRPKWEMCALALHEGVPGHHLQVMRAREEMGQSDYRRFSGYTSFIEGWALYAESLGVEMGLYHDPYSLLGRYALEMLRAVRLVVDTGLHALGWSRQEAIDYFKTHAWMIPEHEIVVEVDRYLVMPGQALGYKVGELKIHEWRTKAKQLLGAKFDIRDFHEQLMVYSTLPLKAIEEKLDQWIESMK